MRPTTYLIDGYNLLHAAGLGQATYAIGDLQRAREGLLARLRKLMPVDQARDTIVVFDARDPPPDRPTTAVIFGIRVMFAIEDGDADAMLEGLIASHSAPKKLVVVSSDHRIQNAARRRRAGFVDSDTFLETLEHNIEKTIRKPRGKSDKIPHLKEHGATAEDLDHWMEVFGDVPTTLPSTPRPRKSPRLAPEPDQIPEKNKSDAESKSAKPSKQSQRPPTKMPADSPQPLVPRAGNETPPKAQEPEIFSEDWVRKLQDWVDKLPP